MYNISQRVKEFSLGLKLKNIFLFKLINSYYFFCIFCFKINSYILSEVSALFQNFFSKVKDSFLAIIPVSLIVLLIHFTIVPLPSYVLGKMAIGVVSLLIGMSFFTLGADTAIMPMGENIGERLSLSRKLWLILIVCGFIGIMITIAEPDVHVLADQFKSLNKMALVISISAGVGIYLIIALIRIIFKLKMSHILLISYGIILLLSFFVPETFKGVAFDAGGVTTGAISVPFILAIGFGISSVRGGKNAEEDSFGLLGLCSIGPVIAIMVLGIINGNPSGDVDYSTVIDTNTGFVYLLKQFFEQMPTSIVDVSVSLAPIVLFYIIFSKIALKQTRAQKIKIVVGIIYTFVGVVIFLTGVNIGFVSLGNYLGNALASLDNKWIIVLIGFILGLSIVIAEPSVQVLVKQVETITGGSIKRSTMLVVLSVGVAISIALCMIRLHVNIPIMYILLPGYILMVILSFFVPQVFTAIAIDSGGIASGTITVAFVLPLAMGASQFLGGNVLLTAFGVSGIVAMTPIITLQLLGLTYKIKLARREKALADTIAINEEEQVSDTIELDEEIIEFDIED